MILQRSEGGVDSALLYAKTVSKYIKDLMAYVEKRTSLGRRDDGFSKLSINRNLIIILFMWKRRLDNSL